VRLLHVSDWHLGRSLYGVDRREDLADALEQSVACAGRSALISSPTPAICSTARGRPSRT
jgi:hypothetical protein